MRTGVAVPTVSALVLSLFVTLVGARNPQTRWIQPVGAQEPVREGATGYNLNQFVLDPAYQEVVLQRDQPVASASVNIKNTTGQATTFEVFAIEFPPNDHFGSLQFVDFKDEGVRRSQPAYITFDVQQFVLEPHHQRSIEVRVSDRAELRPGGTYTAVVVRAVAEIQVGNQIVVPALTSQLLIRKLDGEVRNLSLSHIGNMPNVVSLRVPKKINLEFTNNGNVHLIPRGVVTVTDLFNRTIAKGLINDSSQYVLPSRSRTIPATLDRLQFVFPVSILTVWVDGGAETTHYQYESTYLYISPWLFALAVMLLGGWWRTRKRRATQLTAGKK